MRQLVLTTFLAACFFLSCTYDNRNSANSNSNLAVNTPSANANVGQSPSASTPCPTSDPAFNLPYEAIKDTEWVSNPNPPPGTTPTKGTVTKGTKVFFDHIAPVTPTWQLAMFADGCKKYVHPDDFKKL